MAILDWTLSFWDWIIIVLGVGVLLYFWGMSTYRRHINLKVPHIKPLPFIGNMGPAMLKQKSINDMTIDTYNSLKEHPYGVNFFFRMPVIMLFDLDLIKAITIKDFEYFTDHRPSTFENEDPVWTRSLFSLRGQEWRDMRSTLSPAFTSSKMKTMFKLMSECSEKYIDYLEQCCVMTPDDGFQIEKDGELLALEFKDFFTRYSNDVIATTAFGVAVDSLRQPKNEFYLMGQEATSFSTLKLFAFASMPWLMKILGLSLFSWNIANFFRTLVVDTINTRKREGIVRPDLLQLLMQAQKGTLEDEDTTENKSKSNKKKLDDEDVVSQALLFFLAGFDSTSSVLCFISHQLAMHPDVQTKLQKELDEAFQNAGGKFTYEAIHSMKYLDMVVSETLRLYSPGAAFERMCIRKYTLQSDPPLEMQPGDIVFLPAAGIHRDPRFFDDPDSFRPERFSEENKHKINPMAYFPFGVGPRSCIGNRFALMEVKIALAHLLHKFNLKQIPRTPNPLKLVQRGFNLTVKGGFWIGVEQRKLLSGPCSENLMKCVLSILCFRNIQSKAQCFYLVCHKIVIRTNYMLWFKLYFISLE